jgi:ElaB/YqjD/DUF883 family membrane-anchored ribosome-binding protein
MIMAQSTYGRTSDQITDLKEKATDQFSRVADQAEGMVNRVAELGREAGERMEEVAGNFKGALDRSIRDQPMTTLAAAAIVGFALGALWKA